MNIQNYFLKGRKKRRNSSIRRMFKSPSRLKRSYQFYDTIGWNFYNWLGQGRDGRSITTRNVPPSLFPFKNHLTSLTSSNRRRNCRTPKNSCSAELSGKVATWLTISLRVQIAYRRNYNDGWNSSGGKWSNIYRYTKILCKIIDVIYLFYANFKIHF